MERLFGYFYILWCIPERSTQENMRDSGLATFVGYLDFNRLSLVPAFSTGVLVIALQEKTQSKQKSVGNQGPSQNLRKKEKVQQQKQQHK